MGPQCSIVICCLMAKTFKSQNATGKDLDRSILVGRCIGLAVVKHVQYQYQHQRGKHEGENPLYFPETQRHLLDGLWILQSFN